MYHICRFEGTSFEVIVQNEDQVEVSFTRTWDPSLKGKLVALNLDKRYMLELIYMFILIIVL